jgi:hypothetical protein
MQGMTEELPRHPQFSDAEKHPLYHELTKVLERLGTDLALETARVAEYQLWEDSLGTQEGDEVVPSRPKHI